MPHTAPALPKMRSWLFAPGDSEKKMGKAEASAADIALLDLEDSVSPENKPAARAMVAEQIAASDNRARLWVRINPISTADCIADLAAIIPARPGGVFLPKAEGAADITQLHHYLTALEAAHGIPQGRTLIAALVTETAAAMFRTGEYAGDYPGRERLVAMSWGAEDLSSALGAREQRGADGEYAHTYEMARSLCLIGASAAGVAAIETVQPEFRDLEALEKRARQIRARGGVSRDAGDPPGAGRSDQRRFYAERRRIGACPCGGAGLCRSPRRGRGGIGRRDARPSASGASAAAAG